MTEYRRSGLTCVVALAVATGCATVDPRADYDRAAQEAAAASGYEPAYRPGATGLEETVDGLLAGGVTVDEAVEVALLNNPELQAAFYDVGIARADVVQAGLLSNPSLGASVRFPSGGGLASVEAGLAQNIAELWQIPLREEGAERTLELNILNLARRVVELAHETRTAYYRAVSQGRLHDLAQENLDVADELLELTTARQQIGSGTEIDVNLSRSTVLEAGLVVRSARLATAEARRRLFRLLGLTGDPEALALTDDLPADTPAVSFERAAELARRHRLDLRAAAHLADAAEAELRLECRRVIPGIELGFELERAERKRSSGRNLLADTARASIREGGLTAPDIEPRSARDEGTDFVIGPAVLLDLPIFDQNQAQIAKARYAYEKARLALESLARTVVQDVRGAVDRVESARAVFTLYERQLLPLAERNLQLARESYRVGKSSFLSVLEAQRFFLATRRGRVEARRDWAIALPDLEKEIGVPLADARRADLEMESRDDE